MELSGAVQTRHLVFETSPAPSWYPPSRPILVVSESQRQLAGRTAHPSRCPQTIPKEPSAFKYTWSTIKPAVGEDLKPAKNDMAWYDLHRLSHCGRDPQRSARHIETASTLLD
ncbi:hypothetical protein EG327_004117 [Venturia inaequalis]|uniref:Uncharacterized protein n=1 Tax=Venturia inaequalis TaxID=5025 RepID=A0A8H3Z5J3_VENIN|nr:hypothetical protein EG327_004117 [Venturia inaequalis]